MDFPFEQKDITKGVFLREFSENVDPMELVWHQDERDRVVLVKQSRGWQIQMDNELPLDLDEGKCYYIPKMTYHRILKGNGPLVVQIEEKI